MNYTCRSLYGLSVMTCTPITVALHSVARIYVVLYQAHRDRPGVSENSPKGCRKTNAEFLLWYLGLETGQQLCLLQEDRSLVDDAVQDSWANSMGQDHLT